MLSKSHSFALCPSPSLHGYGYVTASTTAFPLDQRSALQVATTATPCNGGGEDKPGRFPNRVSHLREQKNHALVNHEQQSPCLTG